MAIIDGFVGYLQIKLISSIIVLFYVLNLMYAF